VNTVGGLFPQRNCVKCLERVGVAYRCPYTLRHTFLTLGIKNGATSYELAGIAGHRKITMIESVLLRSACPRRIRRAVWLRLVVRWQGATPGTATGTQGAQ